MVAQASGREPESLAGKGWEAELKGVMGVEKGQPGRGRREKEEKGAQGDRQGGGGDGTGEPDPLRTGERELDGDWGDGRDWGKGGSEQGSRRASQRVGSKTG